jgi:hypothetical protein
LSRIAHGHSHVSDLDFLLLPHRQELPTTVLPSVKVRPGGGRSGKCRGMRDNQRHLEPGLGQQRAKGAKYVAWTGVQRPMMLTKRMGRRGVAGSGSDVVESQRRSEIAFGELQRASPEWTLRDLAMSGLGLS